MEESLFKEVKLKLSDLYPDTFPGIYNHLSEEDINDLFLFLNEEEKFQTLLRHSLKEKNQSHLLLQIDHSSNQNTSVRLVEPVWKTELRSRIEDLFSSEDSETVLQFLDYQGGNIDDETFICNCQLWRRLCVLDSEELKFYANRIIKYSDPQGKDSSQKLKAIPEILLSELSTDSGKQNQSTYLKLSKKAFLSSIASSLLLQKLIKSNPEADFQSLVGTIVKESTIVTGNIFLASTLQSGLKCYSGSLTWQRFEKKTVDNFVTMVVGIVGSISGCAIGYKYGGGGRLFTGLASSLLGLFMGQVTKKMVHRHTLKLFDLPEDKSIDRAYRMVKS